MEDKIVGPLTLKQLIIVGVGGGIDYFLYISLAKVYLLVVWIVPVVVIGLLTLAVAFLKIKGLSFVQYILLTLEHAFKPKKRLWIQGGGEVFISMTQPKPKDADELKRDKQQKIKKDLSRVGEITQMLDTHSATLREKQENLQPFIKSPA